jgi:hypothetical protein
MGVNGTRQGQASGVHPRENQQIADGYKEKDFIVTGANLDSASVARASPLRLFPTLLQYN